MAKIQKTFYMLLVRTGQALMEELEALETDARRMEEKRKGGEQEKLLQRADWRKKLGGCWPWTRMFLRAGQPRKRK